jgi:hypothetical protein
MPNLLSVLGAGAQGVRQGRENAAMAQKASQLFRSIGTEEAQAFADLLMQDPRGASDVVGAFGGWNQLYSNLSANALNAQKVAQGARGLDIQERGLEQRGELGREELAIRRDVAESNRTLSEAELGIRKDMLDLERQKAMLDAILKGRPDAKLERNLSNDFAAEVKKPREEIALAKRGLQFLESDDAISDISSMYAFLKAIDSASVVRPGEIELFRQALSKVEKTALGARGLISPKLLPERVRGQLKTALRKLRDQGFERLDTLETQSLERFTTLGVDTDRAHALMIGRLTGEERAAFGGQPGGTQEEGGFDPSTASDADISAAIRARAGMSMGGAAGALFQRRQGGGF